MSLTEVMWFVVGALLGAGSTATSRVQWICRVVFVFVLFAALLDKSLR